MRRIPAAVAALATFLALSASAATAQQRPGALTPGAHFFSVDVPNIGAAGGGTTLSYWTVRSPTSARGWIATVAANATAQPAGGGSNSDVNVSFGPGIRRYRPVRSNVTSFMEADAGAFVTRQAQQNFGVYRKAWEAGAMLSAGIGAEWFPFQRMSLGATTGLTATFGWGGGDLGTQPVRDFRVGTFITALRMTIYF